MPRWLWFVVLTASAASMVWPLPDLPVLRQIVSIWFVLVCPGMAVVLALRLQDDGAVLWTLAIALSMTAAGVVAMIMLYAGIWSTSLALRLLIIVTLAGLVWEALGWVRRGAR